MNELIQQLERSEAYLAADPGNTDLLARVIDLSLATGAVERADSHVHAALARYPGDAFFRARLGNLHLARQEWDAAGELFEALLASEPHPHLAYNLAVARQMQGLHGDVVAALSTYGESDQLSPGALTVLIRSLQHLRQHDVAIALVGMHESRCAGDPQFLAAAALVYLDEGLLEHAERLSNAALALGQRPLEALVVGGSLALARTDSAAAADCFREALARNATEGRSWLGLGLASLLERDPVVAQGQLENAVTYMPEHIGSWHVLAWCKVFRQELAGAEADFRTALELDRNFGESHGGMAVVQAMQGLRSAAEASIERALGLDRDSLSARYAQMVLAGDTADPARFHALAMRLLRGRQTASGQDLSDVVRQHGK